MKFIFVHCKSVICAEYTSISCLKKKLMIHVRGSPTILECFSRMFIHRRRDRVGLIHFFFKVFVSACQYILYVLLPPPTFNLLPTPLFKLCIMMYSIAPYLYFTGIYMTRCYVKTVQMICNLVFTN